MPFQGCIALSLDKPLPVTSRLLPSTPQRRVQFCSQSTSIAQVQHVHLRALLTCTEGVGKAWGGGKVGEGFHRTNDPLSAENSGTSNNLKQRKSQPELKALLV